MKRIAFLASIALLLTIASCKDDDELSTQEKVTAILTSTTWVTNTVTVDGVDHTALYSNFSIKFDKSTYTTTSGSPVWNASGTWKFVNEEATLMEMDDVREVEVNSTSPDLLDLSFQWDQTTFQPGRVSSLKGKHKFKLKKKP